MDVPDLTGADSSVASSSGSPASRASRPRQRIRLRLRRPALALASRGGDGGDNGGGVVRDDLALPLGMSSAAVLAQVMEARSQEELQQKARPGSRRLNRSEEKFPQARRSSQHTGHLFFPITDLSVFSSPNHPLGAQP